MNIIETVVYKSPESTHSAHVTKVVVGRAEEPTSRHIPEGVIGLLRLSSLLLLGLLLGSLLLLGSVLLLSMASVSGSPCIPCVVHVVFGVVALFEMLVAGLLLCSWRIH